MKLLAIAVTIICCLLMFVVNRRVKVAILFLGMMTLSLVRIPYVPVHNANYLLQVMFLLSEWNHFGRYLKDLRRTPSLRNPILVVSISAIICAVSSQHVTESANSFFLFFRMELFFKYFALCYAFWAFSCETSVKTTLRVTLFCLIILTVFGVLNFVNRTAEFVNAVTEGLVNVRHEDVAMGDMYKEESERFRVISMFKYSFDYGYVCGAVFLLHLHSYYKKLENTFHFFIAAFCCFFGIVFCGCRTVWIAFTMAVCCYYLWCFKLKKTTLYFVFALFAFMTAYYVVPSLQEKVGILIDLFSDNSQTSGSSLQVRMDTFRATMDIVDDGNEFMGKGHGYFQRDLGYMDNLSDKDLYGMESVVLLYWLERGSVGLILWAAFYILFLRYFWICRTSYKFLSGLGTSLIILYLFFSIGTGELGSVYPTMLLLGFVLKAIEFDKKQRALLTAKYQE